MTASEHISDSALAAVRGGIAPRRDNPFIQQMQYELGMARMRSLITSAGMEPLPPYVPPVPSEPSAHHFSWSVGFIGKGPYG
jgi:hypothetical protein